MKVDMERILNGFLFQKFLTIKGLLLGQYFVVAIWFRQNSEHGLLLILDNNGFI
jgi:hypothetical protein